MATPHPTDRLRPGRRITGCAAVLLPHTAAGEVDWPGFEAVIARTVAAGLTPAMNMDTGYVQLVDAPTRARVLATAAELAGAGFLAGAFVADRAGDRYAPHAYATEMEAIAGAGGVPVVFPSHGLNALDPTAWVAAHEGLATTCDRFVGFELGPMFVPYGRIYPLEAYRGLLAIGACIGAKHSSLSRQQEWERLDLRDAERPDFAVFTGNDLAIDMVCYGSDYLLGLAAFAPDLFARRDALWAAFDPGFYELNDQLQFLGAFAFRDPVPAYRRDAAMFLQLRGWIASDAVPDGVPARPEADREVLASIARQLGVVR